MLEFNADTPSSLFESGVVQWYWKEHFFGNKKDQFNSVHDQLIDSWKVLKPYRKVQKLHFSCVKESLEDLTIVDYLRVTAIQAEIETKLVYVMDMEWNEKNFAI